MEEAWEERYYHEIDKKKRKFLLEQAIAEEGLTPENGLRQKVWELRYEPREKNQNDVDYYIRGWLAMSYLKPPAWPAFGQQQKGREIRKIREDWNMDLLLEQGELGERILYQELYNMTRRYLQLCAVDRTYGSTMWGLVRLEQTKLAEKIAKDVYAVAFAIPSKMQMDQEFRILRLAVADAFCDQYPDQRGLLEAGE